MDQQLPSIVSLPKDASQVKSPISKLPNINFPVPQELRDQIYEHLLSSTAVADGTKYRLNTQLFSVNSTIKAKARPVCDRHLKSISLIECAARKLPLHTSVFTSFSPSQAIFAGFYSPTPPRRTMIGWQNAAALDQLSDPDKKNINDLQQKQKFAVTDSANLPDLRKVHDETITMVMKQHGRKSFSMLMPGKNQTEILTESKT